MKTKTKEDFLTVGLRFYISDWQYEVTEVYGELVYYNRVLDTGFLRPERLSNMVTDLVQSIVVTI